MKFEPKDFPFDIEDSDAGLKYLAHEASKMANARLAEMLAECAMVFKVWGAAAWGEKEGQWKSSTITHTARLVDVRERK